MTYEDLLIQCAKEDDRIVVLTAENRAAIRNLPDQLKARFIDTGITEQTMIGVAAGLALRGRIPVVHALATFLTMRAFEFIRTDVGIAHLPVKLVGAVPGFLSTANGPTHQAIEDISLMRSIPGMRIFSPSDMDDLLLGLKSVLFDPHPWYIRYPDSAPASKKHGPFEIGHAEVFSIGEDITILTHGFMFAEAAKTVDILTQKGFNVGLINMRSLEPFDGASILSATEKSSLLVTVEDHFIRGGLYSVVAEVLLQKGQIVPVLPVAFNQHWFRPGLLPDIMKVEGFNAISLAEKISVYYGSSRKKTTGNRHPMAIEI